MKKYICTLLLVLSVFSIVSCSSKQGKGIIHFPKENINLSDQLEFKFIPLETGDDFLIGSISKISIIDDRIFVLDVHRSNCLYVFNINGEYITTIGNKGDGPKDYKQIFDFKIDIANKNIIIEDKNTWQWIYYDLYTHEFISKKRVPVRYSDYLSSGDGNYIFFDFNGFEDYRFANNYIMVTDSIFNPIFSDYNASFKAIRTVKIAHNNIFTLKNEIYIYHHLFPTIYKFTPNGLEPVFELSFESFQFPSEEFLNNKSGKNADYIKALDKTRLISAYGIYESESLMCVQLAQGMAAPSFAIYNKVTDEKSLYDLREFTYSSGLNSVIRLCGANDEYIIASINPDQNIDLNKISNPELYAVLKNINIDDNPVICLFKAK